MAHLILLTGKTNIQPSTEIENYSLNLSSLMKRKKKIIKRKIMWGGVTTKEFFEALF